MSAPIEIQDIAVNGVRSLVRVSGNSELNEAVVFVHGNPGSSEDWIELLAEVGQFSRAVAVDMPGFGKADRPKQFEYSVQGYAQHLAGVIEGLGIERVHLVLHDFGGPWGMAWACKHLKSVASLTLVNIGLLPGYRWHKYAKIWRTPLLGELFVATMTRTVWRLSLNADNPKPFPRAHADRMYDDMDAGTKRAILKLYRATSDLGQLATELSKGLSELQAPVMVLWGDSDVFLPVSYAEQQREFFSDIQVHKLAGCGHWPFFDEPERFASLLVPFLRKSVLGTSG